MGSGNALSFNRTASHLRSQNRSISKDLATQQITVEGDVLVMLKLKKQAGAKGQGDIFFALAEGDYTFFHDQTGRDWGFWEGNFAFYVTME